MSADAQRIAIAEFCGWQWFEVWPRGAKRHHHIVFLEKPWKISSAELKPTVLRDATEAIRSGLPDYLNDDTAIRTAVRQLGLFQLRQLVGHLWTILNLPVVTGTIDDEAIDSIAVIALARPDSLAEALLRTIGQWRE